VNRGVNPRTGMHKTNNSWTESVGGLLVLAAVGFVYAIVSLLQWWLLAIVPALFCMVALLRKPKALRGAFSAAANDAAPEQERFLVGMYLLVLGLACAGVAIATAGSVYACFAASLFWLAATFVAKAQMEAKKSTKAFAYHLADAGVEFLTILTGSLAAYSLFSWWVSRLPTDTATLFQVRSWAGKIAWAHEFLKSLNPSKPQTLLLIAALYGGRIVEKRYAQNGQGVGRVWRIVKFALKWPDRLALIATVAASFTFLASRTDGPAASLNARLASMKEQYEQFRSETAKAIEIESKRQLLGQAWAEMPASLRQELRQEQALHREKEELLEEISWADSKYDLEGTASGAAIREYAKERGPSKQAGETAETDSSLKGEDAEPADFLTAGELRDAAGRASNARYEISKQSLDVKEEMGEEAAKQIQELVFDSERLTDSLKLLSEDYPILGETVGTIFDALHEYAHDRLKPYVERFFHEIASGSKESLAAKIKTAAEALAAGVPWRGQLEDPGWRSNLDGELAAEALRVARARRQLRLDARYAEERKIRKLIEEIREHEREYAKIAASLPDHKDLLIEKVQIETELRSLENAPADADPLYGFKHPAISMADEAPDWPIRTIPVPDLRGGARGTAWFRQLGAPPARDLSQGPAFEQLSALNERCASRVRSIVGESQDLARTRLSAALGEAAVNMYASEFAAERAARARISTDVLPWPQSGRASDWLPRQPGEADPLLPAGRMDRGFERNGVEFKPRVEPRPRVEFRPVP
jgi:hypothetical protein